jgi:hypothetical protein
VAPVMAAPGFQVGDRFLQLAFPVEIGLVHARIIKPRPASARDALGKRPSF